MSKRLLITGASGFIGSFIAEEAVKQGFETWVVVRATSSRRYLQDPALRFIELDFVDRKGLSEKLSAAGRFDYIVHGAGVTKSPDPKAFEEVNYRQTRTFVEVLMELDLVPHRFVHLSSLSVFGPIRETDYTPILESDTPRPNTAYGLSKLQAEAYLQSLPTFPYLILRPTGVYGPRERDYFLMAKSIRNHVDVSVGFRRQDLTFVYVRDVVQAVFCAIGSEANRRCYFLTDGAVYSSRTFSDLIRQELGNPFLLRFTLPLWVLAAISHVVGWVAARAGKSSTLNPDKYRIMKQRNWQCDIRPATDELGYRPAYPLERGVRETMDWYKKEGWL